jgi:hypothetical protein
VPCHLQGFGTLLPRNIPCLNHRARTRDVWDWTTLQQQNCEFVTPGSHII